MGLAEIAASTLVGAEQRIEITARNIANSSTPGYKREIAFAEIPASAVAVGQAIDFAPAVRSLPAAEQGVLTESGSPLDLAISGSAVLLVRAGERLLPSRGGSFVLSVEGTLIDGQGRVLQQAGGGDLVLGGSDPVILGDGTVLVDDTPVGAVGLFDVPDDAFAGLSADAVPPWTENATSEIRQGMLERSNVALADEIVALMQAQRLGESAAQIVRAYDQLLGQASTTFGRRNG